MQLFLEIFLLLHMQISVTKEITAIWCSSIYQKASTTDAIDYINAIAKISLQVLQLMITLQDERVRYFY